MWLDLRLAWDELSAIDWDEVHGMVNSVNVNDGYLWYITYVH